MDVKQFRELGYLQELNRRFLHPLGLALEVTVDPATGEESFTGVWDSREDLEGITFDTYDRGLAERVNGEVERRRGPRVSALGYWVQGEGD